VFKVKGILMTKLTTPAALERLEGRAGEFLENAIASVENEQHIQIKDVAVELVPGAPGAGPAVTVVVTTAPSLEGA
jgi:hypothetical protein